jgi:RNA polymerase sigma-70 factor (ECF subfamily)
MANSPTNSERSVNGDAVDWPGELARHDRWLRTTLYARLRSGEAVDDVMQEVALAAVRQSAPLRDNSKAGPWLYRIAVRQALMYRRRCGRQRRLVSGVAQREQDREATRSHEPLAWLLAAERQEMLRQALAQLPPRDAEILLLKYTEDWNYHQIAAHLGVSHSAVETRLHRARQRLRERLAIHQLTEARG